jgi:chromosome segregation ATPase
MTTALDTAIAEAKAARATIDRLEAVKQQADNLAALEAQKAHDELQARIDAELGHVTTGLRRDLANLAAHCQDWRTKRDALAGQVAALADELKTIQADIVRLSGTPNTLSAEIAGHTGADRDERARIRQTIQRIVDVSAAHGAWNTTLGVMSHALDHEATLDKLLLCRANVSSMFFTRQ